MLRSTIVLTIALATAVLLACATFTLATAQEDHVITQPMDAEKLRALESESAALRARVSVLEERGNYLLTAFAVFGGIMTFMSVVGFGASLWRSGEAHRVAMSGETAAQSRAATVHETFLEGSKNTLDLVNATLTLAKEASERAAKIIQKRAETNLLEITREAQRLIKPSANDRQLIETQAARADLQSVAQKIAMFETNSFMFPEELPLSAPCLFIRGLGFHLDQQYEDAIKYWNRAGLAPDTPADIRSMCWYWIGYVHNNRGRYNEAEDAFARSLVTATGSRKLELLRIKLETRFFNVNQYTAASVVDPLRELLNQARADTSDEFVEDRVAKITTTLANVLLRHSSETGALRPADRELILGEARDLYASVKAKEKWAVFGLAECYFALGDSAAAQALYADEVFELAEREHVNRGEPRTKVLAKTTQLICCAKATQLHSKAYPVYEALRSPLGMIDEGVTVFSQFKLRNVMKRDFIAELDTFVDANPVIAAKT